MAKKGLRPDLENMEKRAALARKGIGEEGQSDANRLLLAHGTCHGSELALPPFKQRESTRAKTIC